ELLPQPGTGLGTARRIRGSPAGSAGPAHRRRPRHRHDLGPDCHPGTERARTQGPTAGRAGQLRSLDSAGTPREGQRPAAGIPLGGLSTAADLDTWRTTTTVLRASADVHRDD